MAARGGIERERLEGQRAGAHAAAAADAGGLVRKDGVIVQGHDGVVGLEDRAVDVRDGATHHGTAHDDLLRLLDHAARRLDDVADAHAERDAIVARIGDAVTGDRDGLAGEGHAVAEVLLHAGDGGDVDHEAAHVDGQTAGGHVAPGRGLDEHLLAAGGVLGRDLHDLDAVLAALLLDHALELEDGLGLVVLDADHGRGDLERLDGAEHTVDHALGVLHHLTVVARDEGLALHAVDHEALEALALGGAHLEPCGKRGASQADHAGVTHAGDELLLVRIGRRLERGIGLHLAIGDDLNHGRGGARGQQLGGDLGDRAGDARVDGRAQAVHLADQRAHIYMITLAHHRARRRADVHVQRDEHSLGRSDGRAGKVPHVLALRRMHAAPCLVQRKHWLPFHISPNCVRPRISHGRDAYQVEIVTGFTTI